MATMNALGTKITVSAGREVTNALQPAFSAYRGNVANNVTGDGTVYTVVCDTERFDKGSNFSGGAFTAPVVGTYLFRWSSYLYQFDVPATSIYATLSASNRDFTNGNTGATVSGTGGFNGYAFACCAAIIDMDTADTVTSKIMMAGTTKTGDVTSTTFCGTLVC